MARNALVEEQVGVHVQKHVELLDGVGIDDGAAAARLRVDQAQAAVAT